MKRRIESRTHWFNTTVGVMAALEPQLGVLQSLLPGDVYAWLAAVLVVGNIICREITSHGLR